MSGEEPTDIPFEQIEEKVSNLKENAGRADELLRDQSRVSITQTFKGLNGRVINESRDLQAFMNAISPKCDPQARVNIHGFKRQVDDIMRERETIATGAFAGDEFEVDTPDEHVNRIVDLTRRVQNLCPLVVRLNGIRQQLNELYDLIRASEEGR